MSFEESSGFGSSQERVKRITLPSGKQINVVSFDDVAKELMPKAEPVESPEETASPEPGLHICQECDSRLVYPTDWVEDDRGSWYVELYCPDCDWSGGGVFEQDMLDEFDEELDRGLEELAADLGRLAQSNMADDVDRFIDALKADAIEPMDF
jgi:hypothetical protein